MNHPAIYSATLGLCHPWEVTTVSFAKSERRMDITVDFAVGSVFTCPDCGAECTACRVSREIWYHDDFFSYATYLHARVPHVKCCCSCVFAVDRPWSRAGSRFSLHHSAE